MKPTVIGFFGDKGTGKNFIAKKAREYLEGKKHEVELVAIADPVKYMLKEVYGFDNESMFGPSECRDHIDDTLGVSYRTILIDICDTLRKYQTNCLIDCSLAYSRNFDGCVDYVLLTDMRHDHEVEAVKKDNGYVIYLHKENGNYGAFSDREFDLANLTNMSMEPLYVLLDMIEKRVNNDKTR